MKPSTSRLARKLRRTALAAAAAALFLPASALGATVSVDGDTVNVLAGPGEANQLVVGWSFGTWIVDDAVPISAGAGCVRKKPTEARCTVSGIEHVAVDAADADDNVTNLTLVRSTLSGGTGSDTLNGGLGPDSLVGGDGDDGLYGSWGDDVLEGGAGTDIFEGNLGADTLRSQDGVAEQVDCGSQTDSYLSDEADTLTECEQDLSIVAGTLPGNAGSTEPGGGSPGTGGSDPTGTVISPLRLLTPAAGALVLGAAGTVALPVECATDDAAGCQGTITLELLPAAGKAVASRRGRRVGRKSFKIKPGRKADVEVRVSRRGRRMMVRRKKRRIRARIDTQTATGTHTAYRTYGVRASRRGGRAPRR